MVNSLKILRRLAFFAVILSFIVVMLGAYTRLTHAGLGCPDWPGCYGRMMVTDLHSGHSLLQMSYPDSPIEIQKAWTEMVHRYFAGFLVLSIILMNLFVFFSKHKIDSKLVPLLLLVLIAFQACLGMWTVTLKLLPLVVMGHLLGGILIFSFLCYFCAKLSIARQLHHPKWRFWVILGILLIFFQISLGGWVSANYAGMACFGFPRCNGQWFPTLAFSKAFNLFLPIGANYLGGILDAAARITIQYIHRIGAMIVLGYFLVFSIYLFRKSRYNTLRVIAMLILFLVLAQVTLGILNVIYLLPLPIAVLHNGVAALLLATNFVLLYLVSGGASNESTF